MAQPKSTFEPSTNLISDQSEQTVPTTIFNTLQPYLYEYDECIRNVRDYKQLTRQFLESSGIQTIGPFAGGPTRMIMCERSSVSRCARTCIHIQRRRWRSGCVTGGNAILK